MMGRPLPVEWFIAWQFLRDGRLQSVLITAGAAVGLSIIIFMSAMLTGLQDAVINRTLTSQPQIVLLPQEQSARPLRGDDAVIQPRAQRLRSIDQWQVLTQALDRHPGVRGWAPVVQGPAMAIRGDAERAVNLTGIEPARYDAILKLQDKLVAGSLHLGSADILIGLELAHELGASPGDRIRLSVSDEDPTMPPVVHTLRVNGILDFGAKYLNLRSVYLPLRMAQSLMGLPGGATQIDVVLHAVEDADHIADDLAHTTGLRADSWMRSNAQLASAIASQRLAFDMIRFFIGLSVAFGIASVLSVSVIQRTRDIGVLRALGASRRQMLGVFLIQGGLFGLAGAILGFGLAEVFTQLFRHYARNSAGDAMFDIQLTGALFLSAGLLATVVGTTAALWPARRAARLDPAEAIRG